MPFLASAVSDAKGVARVTTPEVPGAVVLVDHPGFAPLRMAGWGSTGPLTARLETGQAWRGAVTLPEAEPGIVPPGGTACVTLAIPFPGGERQPVRCATLEADGSFLVGGLGSGIASTTVTVPGFLPVVVRGTALPREITLARGMTIPGAVRDGSHRAIAGATIECGGGTWRSAGDGSFQAAAASLPAEIEVQADGFRTVKQKVSTSEPVIVALERSERITATLLGEEGPLTATVQVSLETHGADGRWRSSSDEVDAVEGLLSVDLPGPDVYRVGIRAPGYRELASEQVTVAAHETVAMGVRVLERGPGVRGVVVDETTGEARAGALVELLPTGPALYLAVRHGATAGSVSDAQGEFLVAGVPLGRYLVRAQCAGAAPAFRLVDLGDPRVVDLGRIALGEGVVAAGRLTAGDGGPPDATEVRLFDAARELVEPLVSATSAVDGGFHLPPVAPGRYRLEVGGDRIRWSQEIELRAGHDADLELPVGGVRLRGAVVRDGLVVPGGSVWMQASLDPANRRPKFSLRTKAGTLTYGFPGWHGNAPIGVDGVFTVDDVPAGQLVVGYQGSGVTAARTIAVPDAAEATVTLDIGGTALGGRVVDAASGIGLAAAVTLVAAPGRPPVTARCDDHGEFRFSDVSPGTYALRATAAGFAPATVSAVPAPLDAPLPPIALRRGEPGKVKVILRRGPEWPLEGVPVLLVDQPAATATARLLMADGELTFSDVDEGSYRVAWADPLGGAGVSEPVEVEADATVAVAPALASGASVTLACPQLRCAGAAVQAVTVIAAGSVDVSPLLPAVTLGLRMSAEGELPLGRLAPGRYRITLHVAGRAYERDVDLEPGEYTVRFL